HCTIRRLAERAGNRREAPGPPRDDQVPSGILRHAPGWRCRSSLLDVRTAGPASVDAARAEAWRSAQKSRRARSAAPDASGALRRSVTTRGSEEPVEVDAVRRGRVPAEGPGGANAGKGFPAPGRA